MLQICGQSVSILSRQDQSIRCDMHLAQTGLTGDVSFSIRLCIIPIIHLIWMYQNSTEKHLDDIECSLQKTSEYTSLDLTGLPPTVHWMKDNFVIFCLRGYPFFII